MKPDLSTSEHARLVHSVVDQPGLVPGGIPPEVASSWRRCLLDYQLDPGHCAKPTVVDRTDLRQRQEKLAPLIELASAEMTRLYQQIAGSGYAILLSDIDGVILNYVGDPKFTDTAMRSGLHNGSVWSEAAQGTNGLGTCIAMQKPMVVHQHEHFLSRHTGLTCSAAPIRDPNGDMIAVLDASSASGMAQRHTMVLVNMAARTIENRMFLCAFKEHFVVRFHARSEFISTPGEAAIALDGAGIIRGANRSAMFHLDALYDGLIGSSVNTVFGDSMAALFSMARKRSYNPIAIHSARDGRRFFAIVQVPAGIEDTGREILARIRTCETAPRPPLIDASRLECLHLGDPVMARNIRHARKLLNRDIPLLLYGETGTGKGMFARAFHDTSERADKPFVAVNCASIPETLIESELFGYRPGAFTGANRHGSRGTILQADGGTLFLDEIGDMPLHLQARLLRVLEEKEVVPLGGDTPQKVDIAVISATHRDLTQLIAEGQFREDLYYRLHGITLTMPALRERRDLKALIREILRRETDPGTEVQLSDEALDMLCSHKWPGNLRQLCNTLRAVVALCEDSIIEADDLPDDVHYNRLSDPGTDKSAETDAQDPLARAERHALMRELEAVQWNVTKVALKLNLCRKTLYRKMKRHGIRPPR